MQSTTTIITTAPTTITIPTPRPVLEAGSPEGDGRGQRSRRRAVLVADAAASSSSNNLFHPRLSPQQALRLTRIGGRLGRLKAAAGPRGRRPSKRNLAPRRAKWPRSPPASRLWPPSSWRPRPRRRPPAKRTPALRPPFPWASPWLARGCSRSTRRSLDQARRPPLSLRHPRPPPSKATASPPWQCSKLLLATRGQPMALAHGRRLSLTTPP